MYSRIVASLNKRGHTKMAANVQAELRQEDIDPKVIRANAPKLVAFANKLSSTGNPQFQKHASTILQIVDNA